MEEKRNQMAVKLHDMIEQLYEEFNLAGDSGDLEKMLEISDRITNAAGVITTMYGVKDLEEQIAMLEKALREASE